MSMPVLALYILFVHISYHTQETDHLSIGDLLCGTVLEATVASRLLTTFQPINIWPIIATPHTALIKLN